MLQEVDVDLIHKHSLSPVKEVNALQASFSEMAVLMKLFTRYVPKDILRALMLDCQVMGMSPGNCHVPL